MPVRRLAREAERDAGAEAHERLAEALDDRGNRAQAEREADLATEAAGRHEREPTDPRHLRVEQEPLRDAAAVGVRCDVDVPELERIHPRGEDLGVPCERVARVGTAGESVAWQVEEQHTPALGELRRDLRPRDVRVANAVHQHERWLGACGRGGARTALRP